MKICTCCKEPKELDQFSPDLRSKDRHAWRCRACNVARSKAWAKAHPKEHAAHTRLYYERHPEARGKAKTARQSPEVKAHQRELHRLAYQNMSPEKRAAVLAYQKNYREMKKLQKKG